MFSIKRSIIVIGLLSSSFSASGRESPSPALVFKNSEEAEAHLKAHKSCPSCDLKRAELAYADLRNADLRGANLRGADLNHADLRGANLSGATLIRADLSTKTLLSGADLSHAILTEANIEPKELALSKTCGAILPNGTKAPPCPVNER